MTVELIYWDSDAFLGWLQEEPGKAELCAGTLERAKAGEVAIITSALTVAEVLWLRNHPRIPKEKAETLRKFFRHSYIKVQNVTRSISESAQDLVWDHGVKPKDAIHVATALKINRISALETFDDDLLKLTNTIGTPPLQIRKPIPPKQERLFP